MSDNIVLNSGSGGVTAASDDIGGVQFQRTKFSVGADGAASDAIPVSAGLDTTAAGVQAVGLVAQLDDASTATVTEDQFAPLRLSSRRALLVEGVASGTAQPVSGTVTANAGTNLNTSALATVAKQPALGTAGTAATDVITIQGIASMTKLLVTPDANSAVNVAQVAGANTLAGNGASGTGAQRVTIASDSTGTLAGVTTVTTVSTLTGGAVAHDGADSGNPHKIGGKAETSPKGITLVADGDRSDLYCDADGILIVKTGTANGDVVSERASNTDGASTAFSTFGAAANLRNCITAITVHNAHATTNGYVDFRDGTGGGIIWTMPLPATGGACITFDPPLRQPTANTALAFDVSAAITTVYISINGYQSKA